MSTADGAVPEHLDVVIVGAGLSGIGTACHLSTEHPQRSYAVLEAREDLGGTWSLFRYPGIRSDSDMHTLGFRFRPWPDSVALADGPSILQYVRDTAAEYGVDRHIRYGRRVTAAAWSSAEQRWDLTVSGAAGEEHLTCSFLLWCSGYYRYDQGYTPDFPAIEHFGGTVVHPQLWDPELDYADKKVVVIGSGATAVTLVPAMTQGEGRAAHVTQLQRTPSYVLAIGRTDPIAETLSRWLPARIADPIVRAKNIAQLTALYQISQRFPGFMKGVLRKQAVAQLPEGYEVDTHFNPPYNPWDQRMCMVPNGDLFKAIKRGDADIVTDRIDTFTEHGIRLASGQELEADIVITATGLNLQLFGGATLTVDDEPVRLPDTMAYKGMMLSGVPNLVFMIGYTNASWTLKVDLVAEYFCRLLRWMDAHGQAVATPERDPAVEERPLLDFEAGYVQRSIHELPRGGDRKPWTLAMNYAIDAVALRRGDLKEGMRFEPERATIPA
ncbi:NAD(P)/FAD-dependent oxidoreductase [Actinomycetospora sp. NBRC 106378]|uniref:flavin-containing monooxygenase n=1 Tax=Actinomycetospora sp. NBRC 106378 TaxID=3032208 RepID=UPI0024A492D7|nr:NAD(P)/FAD-dependent oxidoreductase [Actinomycetospora sp. NBRC 106378]GLZ52112.1 flavin-binding monooxygenase [Actinomycetospora sp. NBRC 106378]